MNFPAGVIYIWPSTHASIPTGWERVTALDGKYPKGTADATNPNDTGGNANHTHTSTGHTHTMSAHTHSITINATDLDQKDAGSGSNIAASRHTHSAFNSGSVASASISSEEATYASIANDPPYYTVIFITPTNGDNYFPDDAIYLYGGTDSKTGHYVCDGNNSTPNLVDKYLKGAGTGANAGGTGGSTTNVHNLTHTHTVSHAHASVTSSDSGGVGASTSGGGWIYKHTHSVALNASTTAPSNTPELTTTETVEPAYTKLLTVQNQNTGTLSYRVGMIGMWLGTLASIPSNYLLCDGTNGTQDMRGKYHKSTASQTAIGNIGGSNTHTHATQGHTHANVSHTHTANPEQPSHSNTNTNRSGSGGPNCDQNYIHNHSSVTVTSANYSLASSDTTADESSNEPQYRTVAFIKLNSIINSSAAVFMSMMSLGQPSE